MNLQYLRFLAQIKIYSSNDKQVEINLTRLPFFSYFLVTIVTNYCNLYINKWIIKFLKITFKEIIVSFTSSVGYVNFSFVVCHLLFLQLGFTFLICLFCFAQSVSSFQTVKFLQKYENSAEVILQFELSNFHHFFFFWWKREFI